MDVELPPSEEEKQGNSCHGFYQLWDYGIFNKRLINGNNDYYVLDSANLANMMFDQNKGESKLSSSRLFIDEN